MSYIRDVHHSLDIKSVDELEEVHMTQLLTYLQLAGLSAGQLLDFNEDTLSKGLRRVLL